MPDKIESTDIQENLDYIRGHIFDADDTDRIIQFKGALIRISKKDTTPLVDLREIKEVGRYRVPAGYEVEVIDGWAKLTKSAAT